MSLSVISVSTQVIVLVAAIGEQDRGNAAYP
jgi:hypothetical protein